MKKARLDLTTDNTENVIETIASFTVRRIDLETRFLEIPFYWAQADAAGKLALEAEFMEIPFFSPRKMGTLNWAMNLLRQDYFRLLAQETICKS